MWQTRLHCVAFQTYLVCHTINYALGFITHPGACATVISWAILHHLNLAELLLVTCVNIEDVRYMSRKLRFQEGYRADIIWQAVCLSFNLRRVGMRFQSKKSRTSNPSKEQNHLKFIVGNVVFVALSYVLVEFFEKAVVLESKFIASEKQVAFQLWKLTPEDFRFRLILVAVFWVKLYFGIAQVIQGTAVILVLLGFSEPSSWPALNGPLSSAQNIRMFWGDFWHQCGRSTLTGFAHFFSGDIMRLKYGGSLSRYVRLALVFLMSGLLHSTQDLILGMDFQQSSTTQFFIMQACAVMIEDRMQISTSKLKIPSVIKRIIGYTWTAGFLYLTTPTWIYPKLRATDQSLHMLYPLPLGNATAYQAFT